MRSFCWRALSTTCLAMLVATSAAYSGSEVILGSDGALYEVVRGTYGDLFPEGTATHAGYSVLALDIRAPDEEAVRLLVPGTEGSAGESAPSMTLDRSSGSLFITWEATRTIHSELYIVARTDDEWSEVLEFSGNPFTRKTRPKVAPTHERYRLLNENGEAEDHSQTILHLGWWDELGDTGRALYAPLIVGPEGLILTTAIELGEFVTSEELPDTDEAPSRALSQATFIQAGVDAGHVIIAFVEPVSGRLVTLSSQLSGAGIDSVADDARAQVIIIGHQVQTRGELASALHQALVERASQYLDSTLADYLAQQAAKAVLEADSDLNLEALADEARAQVIIIGARMRGALTNVVDEARAQVIIIGANHPELPVGRSMALTLLNHRRTPEVPEDAPARVLLSPDGHSMIVAWVEDGDIRYVESAGDDWADQRVLHLGGDLTADQAFAILQRRLDS